MQEMLLLFTTRKNKIKHPFGSFESISIFICDKYMYMYNTRVALHFFFYLFCLTWLIQFF